MPPQYEDLVFINCPFDVAYQPLFEALVFTVHHAGFVARCALEVSDSSKNRLSSIMDLIAECAYGIHDISRTQLDPATGLPRFNMPLEFGIFLGCKRYGGPDQQRKRCLVLDTDRYRYQKFISDIAGQDIKSHSGQVGKLIGEARNFLRTASKRPGIAGGVAIGRDYGRFRGKLPAMLRALHLDAGMTFVDYQFLVAEWLQRKT